MFPASYITSYVEKLGGWILDGEAVIELTIIEAVIEQVYCKYRPATI